MDKVIVRSVYDAFEYVMDHYYPNGQEFAQKYGYTEKIADEVGLYVLFSADEKIVTAFQPWGLLYKLKIQKVLSGASK